VICVDEIIITGTDVGAIAKVKFELCLAVDMVADLDLLHYCLDVEVWQADNYIFISQTKYAKVL
jgi:hypothetical protein